MIAEQRQCGVAGQVIEYGTAALKKKRQVVLRAAGHPAGADFGEGGAEIGVPVETLEPRHLETVGRVAADRELPCGHQFDLLDAVHRALGFRVKSPQGFDLIIEQIDAIGRVAAHREHIQQRAADRELAMLENRLNGAVSIQCKAFGEAVGIKGIPYAEIQGVALDVVLWGCSQHGSGNRQDHDAFAQLG